MALPLKTGADLYNQQLIRARLQNLGAQPRTADVGLGQVYFNTGTDTAASLRIGYCYEPGSEPKFHHVANLEDINRLDGRVVTLEGYFSNGKAKDTDLLDGHNSDYFAEAATLNDLLEDYEAFKAVFSDNSDEYINTWTEVKAFLDGIKNTEDLNAILLGINTELGKKADKATTLAGYGITDGMKVMPWIASDGVDFNNLTTVGSYGIASQNALNGPIWYGTLLTMGGDYNYYRSQLAIFENGQMYVRAKNGNDIWSDWRTVLDNYNYASELDTRYLQLTGGKLSTATNFKVLEVNSGVTDSVVYIALSTQDIQRGSVGYYNGLTYIGADTELSSARIGVTNDGEPQFWTASEGTKYALLHAGNYSDLITNLNNNLNVPSITIGGIKLSVVEGQLQIDGDAFATGQLSSGGIGSEGSGSGASGIVILEDWEKYDDTLAQVLGAGLGVGLRDKIAALESKATKVSVSGLLESGKSIGTIKVDDTSYNLLAPDDYLPLSGGTISGTLTIQSGDDGKLIFDNTDTETYWSLIYFKQNGETYGRFGTQGTTDLSWNSNLILHSGNYASVLDNAYLKLSGGTLTDSVMVNHSSGSKGYLLLTNGASIGGLVTNGTAVELFNVNGYGIGVEGTSDVYVLTNWAKKTLLHSGNFNTFAPTLTGTGASGTWGIDITGAATALKPTLTRPSTANVEPIGDGSVRSFLVTSLMTEGKPHNDAAGTILSFYWDSVEKYTRQLFIGAEDAINSPNKRLAWRTQDGHRWSDWKTIAFTDSTVAGAYTLKNTAGVSVAYVDTNGFFYIGDGIYADTSLKLIGKNIYFASGASATNGLILNPFGNVTIGSIDLAGTNYKLYVDGTMRAQCINIERSNEINAVDNSGSPLALCLNWSSTGNVILAQGGGNVGIGTGNVPYKFNVDGQIYATRQIYSDIGFILRTTDGKGTRASLSHSSNTLYIQSGYNDGSSTAGNMMISGVNTANLASFDVKANKSAFNGRLLVGNPTDSGWVPFQVKGAADIDGPLYISAHAKEGIYFNENGIHWHNTAAGWVSALMEFSSDALMLHQHTTINGDLKVTGNIIADGQVSSGGVAEAGTGAVGGSALDRLVFEIPANTTSFPCEHGLGTRDISVTIYENGNDFQQVLADVYLDSTNVARIVFGSATDVAHKVVIIG